MTSLTLVAQTTRKILILLLFFIVFFGFLFVIYISVKNSVKKVKPPDPITTATIFNKVSRAKFPQQTLPQDLKFTIETISGRLPEASPTAKVYFLPKKQRGILANIKAGEDAKKVGLELEPQELNKKLIYKDASREFTIDPISRDFSYLYNYPNDLSVFVSETILTKNSALSVANTFLNKLSAIPADYDSQNPKFSYFTYNGAQFISTADEEDNENATSIMVSYFRKKIDNLLVVTPKFNEGNIYVLVSKSVDKNKQVIKAQKYYQEISYESIGIYPIKSSQSAWEDFLNGKGYIANSGNSTFTKRVVIRDAYLAYYETPEKQTYLVPIYIFTGDNGFIAYANSLNDEWLIE